MEVLFSCRRPESNRSPTFKILIERGFEGIAILQGFKRGSKLPFFHKLKLSLLQPKLSSIRQIGIYLIILASTYKHKYPNSVIHKITPCTNIRYKGFVFTYSLSSNLHLQCLFCIDSSLCC